MENMLKSLIPLEITYYTIDTDKFKKFHKGFRPFIKNQKKHLKHLLKAKIWPKHVPSIEKQLEYYLSLEFLNLNKDDVYIDIASCLSLFPSYVENTIGCKTYREDILYTDLDVETLIASDACNLPIEDNFFSAITLHCSLEHFEDQRDTDFFKEAARVLKIGGRMIILPFYMGEEYTEFEKPDFAPGCRFHRYYDPVSVKKRLFDYVGDELDFSIFVVDNCHEVDSSCHCRYALLLTRK